MSSNAALLRSPGTQLGVARRSRRRSLQVCQHRHTTCAVSAPSAPPRDATYWAPGRPKTAGKTVVITGGSQGVGRAAAQRFSREGYNVVVAARDAARVATAAEELAAAAPSGRRAGAALGVPTDITSERDVQRLVERVVDTYASVDVVVNCAGVCVTGRLKDTPLAVFQEQLTVNFLGAVAVTQGFQPALEAAAQQGARPVVAMVNSFGGRIPLRSMSAYSASKFALAGFADAIRPELADLGIHVAQIHPGVVKSNFMERAGFLGDDGAARRARMEEMLASGGGGLVQTPEQVADAIWQAVAQRKDEVTVGLPFQLIGAAYKAFNLNPFSAAA